MRNRLRMLALFATLIPFVSAWAADEPKVKLPDLKPEQYMDAKAAAVTADNLEKTYAGTTQPEGVRMLISILRGADLGPPNGWFGPAESRYNWKWLAAQSGVDPSSDAIAKDKFRGPEALFKRLDRDGDGQITPGDLDWADRNPWVQQSYTVNRMFRRINAKGDGKLTREELDDFFKKASKGKDHLTSDDLRDALLSGMGGYLPGDAPTTPVLVRALYAGEIGSIHEGPHAEELAPDFTLRTQDGERTIQLSKLVGSKPVVLVFGSLTCGPFRSSYPDVEAVYQRYKNDAVFVMVYVRDGHPTDGWRMASNDKAGVSVKQPANFAERVKVCDQFCAKLKPSMPVVVDEINDPIGNTYSGMPSRLYVIDTKGKVAYKSSRGPFGFRVGEMEQALVMALLEASPSKKP